MLKENAIECEWRGEVTAQILFFHLLILSTQFTLDFLSETSAIGSKPFYVLNTYHNSSLCLQFLYRILIFRLSSCLSSIANFLKPLSVSLATIGMHYGLDLMLVLMFRNAWLSYTRSTSVSKTLAFTFRTYTHTVLCHMNIYTPSIQDRRFFCEPMPWTAWTHTSKPKQNRTHSITNDLQEIFHASCDFRYTILGFVRLTSDIVFKVAWAAVQTNELRDEEERSESVFHGG